MNSVVSFQIFECATVIFETFIVQQYISGLFERAHKKGISLPLYVLFCIGLTLLSLFYRKELVLTGYTLVGVYGLTLMYKTSTPSRIFAIAYFCAIMIGAEIFSSGLISKLWDVSLSDVLEYGYPRMLCILVAKLSQLLLVKLSIIVANCKFNKLAKDEIKMMFPLLLCQVFSIFTAHCIANISLKVLAGFELTFLFSMIGLLYVNILVFWYFDRIRLAYEYKIKNDIAEFKMELQKQYLTNLTKYQQETDALWHDMKKHINLMKTLVNSGQQDISAEYVRKLDAQMNETIKIIRTDYPILSALLTEQLQRAKNAKIQFNINVKLNSYMKVDPVDLCIILGNLFDNALDACQFLGSAAPKIIDLSILQRNNILIIKIENTYMPNAKKWRPGKHGIGQKNIRYAIAKYNGKMDITKSEDIYGVTIFII